MTTFLFWNLMGNQETKKSARLENLRERISTMASSLGVDVFMFAESGFDPDELVSELNQAKTGRYCYPAAFNNRIQIITRLKRTALTNQYDSEDGRLTIRRLFTRTSDILLSVIHFQSQLNWTPEDQAFQATVVREDILQTEETIGHQRTILVGDLNMNPFDPGMVGAQSLTENKPITMTIPDLWSNDIRVDILSPLVILRSQETLLGRKTKGILEAKVTTVEGENWTEHRLDLIAPALNRYRVTLLAAKHRRDMVYPVTVTAECFLPKPKTLSQIPNPFNLLQPDQKDAFDQDEFINLVREVLQSGEVRAQIQSLIARSNEIREEEKSEDSSVGESDSSSQGTSKNGE